MRNRCVGAFGAALLLSGTAARLPAQPTPGHKPSVVQIVKRDGRYSLLRDGTPYYIRGAGGWTHLRELRAAGGNSVRTWGAADDGRVLDEARRLGLSVTMGLWLGHEKDGFRWDDPKQVQDQFHKARETVLRFKDHPALLMWGIGNEMEGTGENRKIWQAVEAIARMIKEADPNHPTLTVLAGVSRAKIDGIKRHCPSLDAVGVNTYAGLSLLPESITKSGWDGPYVVTEYGPPGPWETPKTPWGAPVEPSSTVKAHYYLAGYLGSIASQKGRCLGSYAYFWGVQPRIVGTHTWYETFLPGKEEKLGAVDALTLAWTGKPAGNRAPEILSWHADPALKPRVEPGSRQTASVVARDPDGDPINVRWEVRAENPEPGQKAPAVIPNLTARAADSRVVFRAPRQEGAYRLFLYVGDGKGNAATANAPFFVKAGKGK